MAELHADVGWLQVRRICRSVKKKMRENFEGCCCTNAVTLCVFMKANANMLMATIIVAWPNAKG